MSSIIGVHPPKLTQISIAQDSSSHSTAGLFKSIENFYCTLASLEAVKERTGWFENDIIDVVAEVYQHQTEYPKAFHLPAALLLPKSSLSSEELLPLLMKYVSA